MARILIKRVDDAYKFEATDENGHTGQMDAAESIGGHNAGFRPMQALLMGLGNMVIDGEREPDKEPSLWKYVHILFQFTGNIDAEKAKKACSLSIDKYCSVAATLRAAGCTIEWDIEIKEV